MRRHEDEEGRTTAITLRPDGSRNLRLFVFAALGFMLLLTLAACDPGAVEPTPTPTQNTDGPSGVVSVTLETPDVLISMYQGANVVGGDEVRLSEVVGQGKPVVLNFWAALCGPCRAEMPDFQRVAEERSDEITVLGIDIGPQQFLGSRAEGQALLADLGVTYPVGTTFDNKVVRNFEVVGMPTTFFIKPDGSLHRSWSGLLTEGKINEIIDEMLKS
ncbi:MAG: TlpA disulfide reductase family protein [Chloroflexi bacterium]|nr:TlpA disulfide reductase family protein [Chloroflexota bacterium]